jgi:hypothetical protein
MNREQKLIDLCFQMVLVATTYPGIAWFKRKSTTMEMKANWVAEQLRGCGFDTSPCCSSWGVLKQ